MPSTTTTASGTRRPLSQRKLDILYLVFFIIHVPIMYLIDLSTILPSALVSPYSSTLVSFHIDRFHDRFFLSPPAWFTAYMWVELVYHVPLSLWMGGWGILRDHPLVPLHLLLFSLEVAVTTLTCLVDISAYKGYTAAQRTDLYSVYGPYLGLACLMFLDAFTRVSRQIQMGQNQATSPQKTKKTV